MRRMFLYWNLQMSWRLKLGLFALTGGGLVVGAAAVLKTMYIRVIQVTDDITCKTTDFLRWASQLTKTLHCTGAFADLVIWLL